MSTVLSLNTGRINTVKYTVKIASTAQNAIQYGTHLRSRSYNPANQTSKDNKISRDRLLVYAILFRIAEKYCTVGSLRRDKF